MPAPPKPLVPMGAMPPGAMPPAGPPVMPPEMGSPQLSGMNGSDYADYDEPFEVQSQGESVSEAELYPDKATLRTLGRWKGSKSVFFFFFFFLV